MFYSLICKPVSVNIKPHTPKIVYLRNKAAQIRRILKKEQNYIEQEILYSKLYDINEMIKEVSMDPLTHDVCVSEPWLLECKLYDC
jgi:uncharacterized protein (UPF0216 family)